MTDSEDFDTRLRAAILLATKESLALEPLLRLDGEQRQLALDITERVHAAVRPVIQAEIDEGHTLARIALGTTQRLIDSGAEALDTHPRR